MLPSISASSESRNPNPKHSSITESSTSNCPKKSTKPKGKHRRRNRKNKKKPKWLELPEDVWSLILSKLNTIEIIENVQKVCMLFRKICKQPSMFRIIDMDLSDPSLSYEVNNMTRYAVDRSAGCLVDIYLEYLCNNDTLNYIADRSKNLKHLRLGHCFKITDEGLIEAVKKLPMLEEVQLMRCEFSPKAVKDLGHACPSLKSFSLTYVRSKSRHIICNEGALAIANSMPQLRHLQLTGNSMTNESLKAILDGCPLLESLDILACFNVDLSGDLGKRCREIKHLRLPYTSSQDYALQAYIQEVLDNDSDNPLGYDSEFGYDGYSDLEDGFPDYLDDGYLDYLDIYDDFTVPHLDFGEDGFLDF